MPETKPRCGFRIDAEQLEKVDAIVEGLDAIEPRSVSRSKILRVLIGRSLRQAERGEIELFTSEGEVDLAQFLDEDSE